MQIKSQPLANKILGLANKTSFAGGDFTLLVGLALLLSHQIPVLQAHNGQEQARLSGIYKAQTTQNWFQLAKKVYIDSTLYIEH